VAVPLKATLVPTKTRVPAGGAAIVTTGGLGVIVTWTWAEPTAPSESVAEATSVWLPSESIAVRPGPGPSAPSRLDVHWMRLVTSPSKSSAAVAASVSGVPAGTTVPSAGAAMVTTGGWVTVIVIAAWPTRPPVSVARALIVCTPGRSAVVATVAPVPRGPSRLELHSSRLPRSPSSASVAAPAKATGLPGSTLVPDGGARMLTSGAVFCVSVIRSSGLPVDASRLAYLTQSLEAL